MQDPNTLFEEITKELTSPGQLFETREYKNSKEVTHLEYASFPDNLKGYFDIGLLHGDKEFLVYESERFLFKDVIAKAAQVGNALIAEGVSKGDRVAICMQNNPEFIFAYMGIVGVGAVCVPLNSWWVPDEIIYAIDHCEAKVLFGDQKRLKGLESLQDVKKIVTSYTSDDNFISFTDFIKDHSNEWPDVEVTRDDHATIYYTSGSTGKPKGVLSSQRGVISSMFSWACVSTIFSERERRLGNDSTPLASSESSILLCVPLFHATGSHVAFLLSILVGRKVVMMKKWDAGDAIKLIDEEKISDITGVPTQTWELLNHPDKNNYDLSSLRTLGGGGGPRPSEHVKLLDDNFEGRPGIGYGLTETNALGTIASGDEYVNNPSTAGRVIPPLTEIKIIDKDWNELAEGEIGEVAIKSQSNMLGYWRNDDATNECMNDSGWFRSGDMGKFEGPFLFIVDRIKDMVIRGGENIACPEVENAIYEHPDVLEACVFGIPDERLGEILCTAIYLKENSELTKDTLIEFLSNKLAAFKIPVVIEFLDSSLPLVASGKFDKPALRTMFAKD
jgi:acyl-CoA synthetase (AMP-forming)/AMP-acid ligase II